MMSTLSSRMYVAIRSADTRHTHSLARALSPRLTHLSHTPLTCCLQLKPDIETNTGKEYSTFEIVKFKSQVVRKSTAYPLRIHCVSFSCSRSH